MQASVIVESLASHLRCLLFFVEQSLEPHQLLLHVLVDLQVPRHNHLHLVYVVVDVAVLGVLSLDVLDEFALLCDHVSYFFEVFEVVHSELLLLLHDAVDFLLKSYQTVVDCGLAIAVA